MREMCVIGLGLIGGSLLRAATTAGRTAWAAADSTVDAEAATMDGYDAGTDVPAALRRAAERDAMVVLAVPLTAVDDVLRQVGEYAPTCVLTDVTSVKAPLLSSVRRLAPATRYVGGHPMSGTARSGWTSGRSALFAGSAWVACVEEDTNLAAWADVAELALEIGARVVPLPSAVHDEVVARISHLPHLLAAVLAGVGAQGGPLAATLAAGSFADGTRVAGTRPELVRAMTEGNRDALLPVLDEALGKLGAARGSLASTGGLASTINAGNQAVRTMEELRAGTRAGVQVDLSAPDARDALCALGERGGRITAIDGTTVTGEVA